MPLSLVTLGFGGGTGTASVTAGLGGDLVAGASRYRLDSVEIIAADVLRVRFTAAIGTTGSPQSRADVAANYTLIPAAPILVASAVSSDPEVVDLRFTAPLLPGAYLLTVAGTLHAADGAPIQGPLTVAFVLAVIPGEPLGLGAADADAEQELLRRLHPAYRGHPNFRAVVAALAAGDALVRDQARAAFDALYVASATGGALVRRGSDVGVPEYPDVGLSDDQYRGLVTAVHNKQLTQAALLRMVEAFYGPGSTRAYADLSAPEPYVLAADTSLVFRFDGDQIVSVPIDRRDYRVLRRAQAQELAAAITARCVLGGSTAYAVARTDPDDGLARVRVYSGTRGTGSSVEVLPSTAAPAVHPPTALFPAPASLPGWSVQDQGDGTVHLRSDSDAAYNLGQVRVGDYVVLSEPFAPGNRGAWTVTAVRYAFASGVVDQWVRLVGPTVFESVAQQFPGDVQFYRPTRRFARDNPSAAIVDQHDGRGRVVLPATAVIHRDPTNASYGHDGAATAVTGVTRTPDGITTVTTAAPHGVQVAGQVEIAGVFPSVTPPAVVPGIAAGSIFATSDLAVAGTGGASPYTQWESDAALAVADAPTVVDLLGDAWVLGGLAVSGGAVMSAGLLAGFHAETVGRAYAYRYRAIATTIGTGAAGCLYDSTDADRGDLLVIGGYQPTQWVAHPATALTGVVTRIRPRAAREPVLVVTQLVNGEGILAGFALAIQANPASGDAYTVSDGATAHTYTFGSGVTIAGSAAASASNLAVAIATDAGTTWTASWSADPRFGPAGFVFVFERHVVAARSTLRAWANTAGAANAVLAAYATATQVAVDYTAPTTAVAPATSDPGFGLAGFHRGAAAIADREIHEILAPNDARAWAAGPKTWGLSVAWADAATDAGNVTAVADAGAARFPGQNLVGVVGGVDTLNRAIATIQTGSPATATWSTVGALKEARSQPAVVPFGTGLFVCGGRQPAQNVLRSAQGFASWQFEDAGPTTTFAGPVTVNRAGNPRPPGKIGWGVQTSAPMEGSPGAAQSALNAQLTSTTGCTVSGWWQGTPGCVVRCGTEAWASAADNTAFEFGVKANGTIYVAWDGASSGPRTLVVVPIGAVTTAVRGPVVAIPAYPVYHHWCVVRGPTSGGSCELQVYIDGLLVTGSFSVAPPPAPTSNAVWVFGSASSESTTAYQLDQDLVGVAGTPLTAAQVYAQYAAEVGDRGPHPVTEAAIGRVLASCESVATGGTSTALTSMAYARYGHSLVALPDGRLLVVGGIGYPGGRERVEALPSQAELRSAEVYEPSTGTWTEIAPTAEPHSFGVAAYDPATNRVYVAGGLTSSMVEYLDLARMTWLVGLTGLGAARGWAPGARTGAGVLLVAGGLTTSAGTKSTPGHGAHALPGGETGRSRLNGGYRALAGTTGATIVVHGAAAGSAAVGGTVVASAEPLDPTSAGPYLVDPTGGHGVGDAVGQTVATLEVGRQYAQISLGANQALAFPDQPGYVLFGLGQSYQAGPVAYAGRVSADALALDARYVFSTSVPAGADCALVTTRGPYIPADAVGTHAFYATNSPAGRVGAQEQLGRITAAGIPLDVTIAYPGDRGLGNEGAPDVGQPKLSDVVGVFAGPDQVAETAAARATAPPEPV